MLIFITTKSITQGTNDLMNQKLINPQMDYGQQKNKENPDKS